MSHFVTFQVIWWIVLFMVLPFGITIEKKPKKGFADSAPSKPNIKQKLLITTGITIVLWSIVSWGIAHNWFDVMKLEWLQIMPPIHLS